MNETVKKDLAEAQEVCPTTTRRLLSEGALLVDVREPGEVAQAGFGDCEVITIPMSEFETRWTEVPRDRDVILASAVGGRSLKATYFLMYQGYDRVTNMQYGMARWAARGFPVTGDAAAAAGAAPVSACGCGDEAAAPVEAAPETSCCGGAAATSAAGCGCESTVAANDSACTSGGACC
jgi:rhodanese-related sulfurtransferase